MEKNGNKNFRKRAKESEYTPRIFPKPGTSNEDFVRKSVNMADQPPHLDKEMKSKISILDYIVSKTQAAIETDEQALLLRQLKAVKTVM